MTSKRKTKQADDNAAYLEAAKADQWQIAEVARLAALKAGLEDEVRNLTLRLKAKAADLAEVTDNLLPDAMDAAGLKKFTTTDGLEIDVRRIFRAGKLKRADGLNWLRANGHAELIKREVSIEFTRGQDNMAGSLAEELRERFPENQVSDEAGVNNQTLQGWARERIEAGKAVPLDLLGISVHRHSKLTKAGNSGPNEEEN